jgi:hypothetical protein
LHNLKSKSITRKLKTLENSNNTNNKGQEFKSLAVPTLNSVKASADGYTISALFNVDSVPILPATDPYEFYVELDGVPVPIIRVRRTIVNFKTTLCRVATTQSLTATYNNGSSGVGATLTFSGATQSALVINSIALAANDRVLVKNQDPRYNGMYRVTNIGSASTNWVLTRDITADSPSDIKDMAVYVESGTNIGTWQVTATELDTNGNIVVGTSEFSFEKISNDTAKTYEIELSAPIKRNMDASLSYFPGVTDYITNNNSEALASLENEPVDVSEVKFPYNYFDPILWAADGYVESVPNGALFERSIGLKSAPVVYDDGAPYGDVTLHKSISQTYTGMNIHYFKAFRSSNNTEASAVESGGRFFIQDILENTVRIANNLGGATNQSQFETIGDGYNYYIVNYLDKVSSASPTIKYIEFGLTASSPKNYVLEVKLTYDSAWTPLIFMYASNRTLEYYRYVFTTAVQLYAVRIRYRGDYYYLANQGLATVAAKDTVSGIEAVRISHFSDFSDANEFLDTYGFPNSERLDPQGEGWFAFVEGTSFYDWDIINEGKVWSESRGIDESALGKKLFNFNNSLLAVVGNKIYTFDPTSTASASEYTASSAVNDFVVHNNKLYVGLQGGSILVSQDGATFEAPGALSNLPPVKALASFQNRLWIGTSLDASNIGYIYSYIDTSNTRTVRRKFEGYEILSLGASTRYLFVGLGSQSNNSKKGLIYVFEGTDFTQAYNTQQDRVEQIEYYAAKNQIWAGCSDGSIYVFTFTSTGTISTVSRLKQLGSPSGFSFLNFKDSPDNEFFWTITSNEVVVYSSDFETFYEVYQPSATSIRDVAYFGQSVYGIGLDGNLYLVDLALFQTDERKVYIQTRDIAGNESTTVIDDSIIFGLPSTSSTETAEIQGAIFQIKIPIIYEKQPTTANGSYTIYTTVQKWSSSDSIEVYLNNNTTPESSSTYTNLNNGSIQFNSAKLSTDSVFITIISPSSQDLQKVAEYETEDKTSALFAPYRLSKQTGIYESEPFYAPSLNRWDKISVNMHFESADLQVDVYVRAADTRSECLNAAWSNPFTYSTINTTSALGIVLKEYSIHDYNGKWLQFKLVLSTSSINKTPKVDFVNLSYFSARDTYFFTKRFDTADESTAAIPPTIRRGLLTYNGIENGGRIQFKYYSDDDLSDSFDITRYIDITPNTVFNLETPARYIRFAILIVSSGDPEDPSSAAIVDEFAVQLETGEQDLYWMNPDIPVE